MRLRIIRSDGGGATCTAWYQGRRPVTVSAMNARLAIAWAVRAALGLE